MAGCWQATEPLQAPNFSCQPLQACCQHLKAPYADLQESNLGQYTKPIQQVAVLRLLQQLSQAYSSMRVSALAKMVPFMPFNEVELLIVDAVKAGFLQVRSWRLPSARWLHSTEHVPFRGILSSSLRAAAMRKDAQANVLSQSGCCCPSSCLQLAQP